MLGKKLLTISKYTFKEILKSKILYVTLVVGLLLMLATYVATEFTYGVPEKVALDFGLGLLSFSSLGISLFLGATLLAKEIDSRTVYMVISRPVPRWIFISGKILGLISVQLINLLILTAMTLLSFKLLGGRLSPLITLAIVFNLLESILLLLVVVFFSLFSNTVLATFISFVLLLLGHGTREALETSFVQNNPLMKGLLEFYHFFLPGFYKLNLKNFVVYEQSLPASYLFNSASYAVFYSLFLFFLIVMIFNKKNLD